jgi:NADPH2:quinone reductase
MKAWVVSEITELGSMTFRDEPTPGVAGDACLVRVEAAGVNFLDKLMIRGQYQEKPPLPFTPGIEVVGTVTDRCPDSPYAIGDRLCAMIENGGYAEFAVVPRLASQQIPLEMPSHVAVGLPIIYPTAYLALVDRTRAQAGETVLVHGGAGGVGSGGDPACQTFRRASDRNRWRPGQVALCRELGADIAIDYGQASIADEVRKSTDGRGVGVVIDPVGGNVAVESLRVLAWAGRLVIVGFAGGQIPSLPANRLLLKNASALGVYWGRSPLPNRCRSYRPLQKSSRPLPDVEKVACRDGSLLIHFLRVNRGITP